MHFIRSIVLSTIVASLGSTSLASSDFDQLIPRNYLHSLVARQASSTDSCDPICKLAKDAATACKTPQCVCSTSITTIVQQCIDCTIALAPSSASTLSDVQKDITEFNNYCANFTGVSLTLPGSTASTTSPVHGSGTTQTRTLSQGSSNTTTHSQALPKQTTAVAASTTSLPNSRASITSTGTGTASMSTNSSGPTNNLPVASSGIRKEINLHEIGPLFGLVWGIMSVV